MKVKKNETILINGEIIIKYIMLQRYYNELWSEYCDLYKKYEELEKTQTYDKSERGKIWEEEY